MEPLYFKINNEEKPNGKGMIKKNRASIFLCVFVPLWCRNLELKNV
jgi:hypothetical protein